MQQCIVTRLPPAVPDVFLFHRTERRGFEPIEAPRSRFPRVSGFASGCLCVGCFTWQLQSYPLIWTRDDKMPRIACATDCSRPRRRKRDDATCSNDHTAHCCKLGARRPRSRLSIVQCSGPRQPGFNLR